MKKTISVMLAVLMMIPLLVTTACRGGEYGANDPSVSPDESTSGIAPTTPADTSTEPVTLEPGDDYVGGWERFTLTADKTSVAPGDTVTVTLRADNCKNIACFDLLITASEALTYVSGKEQNAGDFITTVSELADGVQFSAIVATTSSIDSLDMLTLTYTVSPDAVPGDTLSVQGEFTQYLVGTDESGDYVADATSLISVEPLTLTVS